MFSVKHDLEVLKEMTPTDVMDDPHTWRDMLALFYFFSILLGSIVKDDPIVYGCSLSQKGRLWLLVVKVHEGEIPRVAYTMNDTPTGCIRAFARAWMAGEIQLRPDKFA